jgi:hypothetical protein
MILLFIGEERRFRVVLGCCHVSKVALHLIHTDQTSVIGSRSIPTVSSLRMEDQVWIRAGNRQSFGALP